MMKHFTLIKVFHTVSNQKLDGWKAILDYFKEDYFKAKYW